MMQPRDYEFGNSHLARHCSAGSLQNGQPGPNSFKIRRNKEGDLSFYCLEKICPDCWLLENGRPYSLTILERFIKGRRTTKDSHKWAISRGNIILEAIREAACKVLGCENKEVSPRIVDTSNTYDPFHVGVAWESPASPEMERQLDIEIANKIATRVEYEYPAKNNE